MTDSKTIILAFPLGNSAVSDYFQSLSAELVRRGYYIIIISPGKLTNLPPANPSIYCWPSKRPTRWQDALLLAKILKQYEPVLVMSNFGAVNICLLTSCLLGVPLRFSRYHTTFNQDWRAPKRNTIRILMQVPRKALVYNFATMILPVAEAMSQELRKIYLVPQKKIKSFHNALEDPKIQNMGIARSQKKLLCIGRLSYGKGQDVLLQALVIVKKKYPEVKLQIIGGGDYRTELLSLVDHLELSSMVELTGQISHDRILSLMAEANAVIVPSRYEACPYVVIEAMSVGTPVIASAVGGIVEMIRDEVEGFLVPPENPEILAERIEELLGDYDLQVSMGRNARDRFLNEYELTKAIKNEADWIESQIHQKITN